MPFRARTRVDGMQRCAGLKHPALIDCSVAALILISTALLRGSTAEIAQATVEWMTADMVTPCDLGNNPWESLLLVGGHSSYGLQD